MKIEENYKIGFPDRLFQGLNEVHIFVRTEYKEFIKWTELNYGNYDMLDIFRQGKRVEYLAYINFDLPVCVDIQANPDLPTPALYGHPIIADSLLISGEKKLLHFL